MTSELPAQSWAYADSWLDDVEVVRNARIRSEELGLAPISVSGANLLTVLAATLRASAVVEVGTGAGVSGAALLAGMAPEGVLTSIDTDAEHQRGAREAFTALGHHHQRIRLITGRALDVLPRLTDHAYDIVFADGDVVEYSAILAQAVRLLRIGGLVVFNQMLADGRIADPAQRDTEAVSLRDVAHAIRDDDRWQGSLLTVGSGLLVAVLLDR